MANIDGPCNISIIIQGITFKGSKDEIGFFSNSEDPHDAAHDEPHHVDLLCLPSLL